MPGSEAEEEEDAYGALGGFEEEEDRYSQHQVGAKGRVGQGTVGPGGMVDEEADAWETFGAKSIVRSDAGLEEVEEPEEGRRVPKLSRRERRAGHPINPAWKFALKDLF